MVFTHAFVGALTSKGVVKNKNLSVSQITAVYAVGVVASILPDLDTVVLLFDNTLRHRYFLSHSFIPYLAVILLGFFIAFIIKSEFFKLIMTAFTLGAMSHLVLDYFYGGIAAFAPLKRGLYGFPMSFAHTTRLGWLKGYMTSRFMLGEIIIFALYLINFTSLKNRAARLLPLSFMFASFVMLVLITFI